MERSSFIVDLGAIRRNAATLSRAAAGAELWAVVKAEGYGHGAVDVGKAALDAGAAALCVATLPEALHLRAALRNARILVLGPVTDREVGEARAARLELVAVDGRGPEGLPVHLKVDTGMGRWGLSELPAPTRDVVGVMSHLASADADLAFTQLQVARFRDATANLTSLTRHIANSAATLRYAEARFDAVRCGIALYGISPFGGDPADEGLEPALRWDSYLALVKRLEPGDMTGTEVLVDGTRCPVVGTISMDGLAVVLAGEVAPGSPVTLVGDGIRVEEHARVAGTIGYEIATGLNTRSGRARRVAVDA